MVSTGITTAPDARRPVATGGAGKPAGPPLGIPFWTPQAQ